MGDATTVTRCHVLLVDDDPAICSLVRAVLSDEGVTVYVAQSAAGFEAWLAILFGEHARAALDGTAEA